MDSGSRTAAPDAERRPNAGSDTFVSRSASSYKATDAFHRHFGDDAVIILIRESLPNLVETTDLGRL